MNHYEFQLNHGDTVTLMYTVLHPVSVTPWFKEIFSNKKTI